VSNPVATFNAKAYQKFELPYFHGGNDTSDFAHWKHRVKRALLINDLFCMVDGSIPRPLNGSPDLLNWLKMNELAKGQMDMFLKDDALEAVRHADDASTIWNILNDSYEGKGRQRIVGILNDIFHTVFSDTEPLEPQLNKFISQIYLINKLSSTVFDDEIIAVAIINALPDSLETLKTILANNTVLSTQDVKLRIINDERRRVNSSGSRNTAAYYAKVSNKGKGGDKDKDKDKAKKKRCTHCNFRGHDVSECRKLKKEKAKEDDKKADTTPKSKSKKASAKIAVADQDGSDDSSSDSDTEPIKLFNVSHHRDTDLRNDWIMDSGATRSMSSNREWFSHYTPFANPINIVLGDNSTIQGLGTGRIAVEMHAGRKWHHAVLQNVLHVPEIHGNLLSVSQLLRHGADIRFTKGKCQILDTHGQIACEGTSRGSLFVMNIRVPSESARVAIVKAFPKDNDELPPAHSAFISDSDTSKADAHTWHRRLGHLHDDAVLRMVRKGMVRGMEITNDSTRTLHCEPCLKGKQTRTEIRKATETRADDVLGRIFSDVCGKLPTKSIEGYEYFVTFTDDKSRNVQVFGLKHKSEVAQCLKVFIARAEVETGKRTRILRSDGGGEYTGAVVQNFLRERGIKHEVTTPETPQHNGVSERMNRTLLDKVRTMLYDSSLPPSYWYHALEYAVLLHNISPTQALPDVTPAEAWSGNKPDVSHIRVFGSKAFVHIPDSQRDKLSAKSLTCVFLGRSRNKKAYSLVHQPTRRFLESRDVVFDEGGPTTTDYDRVIINIPQTTPAPTPQTSASTLATPNIPTPTPTETQVDPAPSQSKRITREPYNLRSRRQPDEQARVAIANDDSDPRTYAEAMSRPDASQWELACDDEKRAFERLGVYEVVPRPKDRKIVGSRWVFRIKRGPDGTVQKYKARVVAQGFTQIEGIDYDETFAPVAKLASLRTILALSAELDLELHQMDVKSAYLNGALSNEIFMEPPPGFDIPSGMVLRLIKAVYGTKQGGRVWYDEIKSTLNSMGYSRTNADHAVFTRGNGPDLSILALYVDDITMAARDLETVRGDKLALSQHYQMTDLGEMSYILGMHVTRDRKAGWISLSQERHAADVLERFGKSNVRPISTPALANERLNKLSVPAIESKPYQSAVGALMYPMLGTRPDLAFSVAVLGRHSASPGPEHQHALDRVFRYLRGSSSKRLVFQRGSPNGTTLQGYVDADWASDVNDRKSTTGFVFMLGGCAISWGSKKQATIALSSTEAEYIAAAISAKEAVWLRGLLTELGIDTSSPTCIFIDNQSAIAIARNPEFHDRTKHIEVRYHFLRQKIENREIELEYIPTGEQVADALTKGLSREKLVSFSAKMGLRDGV
ncbi:MAG TPA: reverse transcriptase domain-containing protein, partial [Candidatus Udaeobacter sp.]|nr:reverse transcriptase domain-containing protein [Candidatus Udaeobacter sp.]